MPESRVFTLVRFGNVEQQLTEVSLDGTRVHAKELPKPLPISDGPHIVDDKAGGAKYGKPLLRFPARGGGVMEFEVNEVDLTPSELSTLQTMRGIVKPHEHHVDESTQSGRFVGDLQRGRASLQDFFASRTKAELVGRFLSMGTDFTFIVDTAKRMLERNEGDPSLLKFLISKDEFMTNKIWPKD